ncbi:MAG: Uncharacterized protein G01um101433_512, partial [Parcubacteria group bacterium Gr01-1014_33]
APETTYEFTLFDALGPVARKTGTAFVLPQEEFMLVETNLETTRRPVRVELRILAIRWDIRKETIPGLIVEKRDYEVREENGKKRSAVAARIFNGSLYDLGKIEVVTAVFDPAGNLIGVNKIVAEDVAASSRREIQSLWPEELKGDVATIEVTARVNVFDPDVILKPQ